jgi:hypothetical protein
MSCCSVRTKRKLKKGGTLHKQRTTIVDNELEEKINCSVICGGCKDVFRFDSFELKIHCNLCEQFFHCKVAGPCRGPACQVEKETGIKHRARYCYSCIDKTYDDGDVLCKECALTDKTTED